jgi:hypothetical protein
LEKCSITLFSFSSWVFALRDSSCAKLLYALWHILWHFKVRTQDLHPQFGGSKTELAVYRMGLFIEVEALKTPPGATET